MQTPAIILAQYRDMADDWLDAMPGGHVFIELTAKTTSMVDGGSTDLDREALNAAIIAMCAEPGWAGKLDYFDMTAIETDLANASLSSDGTHYTTAQLAYRAALIVSAKLNAIMEPASIIPAGTEILQTTGFGPNVHANWALADVGGDGVPDGFSTQTASGATVTFDFVTRGGKRKARMRMTGSRSSAGANDRLYRTQTGLTVLAGEVFEALYPFEISGAGGSGDTTEASTPSLTSGLAGMFGTVVSAATGPLPAIDAVARPCSSPVAIGSGVSSVASLAFEMIARGPVAAADTAFYMGEGVFFRRAEVDAYAPSFNHGASYARLSDGTTTALFPGPVASKSSNIANVSAGNVSGGGHFKAGGSLTYQWRKDGSNIPGATNRFYDTTGATGSYDCDVTHHNALGDVTVRSNAVTY